MTKLGGCVNELKLDLLKRRPLCAREQGMSQCNDMLLGSWNGALQRESANMRGAHKIKSAQYASVMPCSVAATCPLQLMPEEVYANTDNGTDLMVLHNGCLNDNQTIVTYYT